MAKTGTSPPSFYVILFPLHTKPCEKYPNYISEILNKLEYQKAGRKKKEEKTSIDYSHRVMQIEVTKQTNKEKKKPP